MSNLRHTALVEIYAPKRCIKFRTNIEIRAVNSGLETVKRSINWGRGKDNHDILTTGLKSGCHSQNFSVFNPN